jgi:hypothetical protein
MFVALAAACGGSDGTPTDDDGAGAGTSTGVSGGGGAGAGDPSGVGGGTGTGTGTGGSYTYSPPDLQGQVFVSHYLGDYELFGVASADLSTLPGSPMAPGAPTSGVAGIAKHGHLAVALEGGSSILVYDAATMSPLAGSPYTTGNGPVDIAHDDAKDRLYVYCIGTEGDPTKSLVTVFDTSSVPYQEIAGSPFDIDVAATAIDVDPVSGALFGVSLFTRWAVTIEDGVVAHLSGSPADIADGVGSDVVVDPARRRVYLGERIIGQDQKVHAFDVETLAPIAGSPVVVPGSSLGDLALNPVTGDLFAVDFGSAKLHSIAAEPLALRDTCGSMGCFVPTTETGLSIDYELDRLFIVHVPDLNEPDAGDGFLTAWDISDPAMPTEITMSGSRPKLGIYPVTATSL